MISKKSTGYRLYQEAKAKVTIGDPDETIKWLNDVSSDADMSQACQLFSHMPPFTTPYAVERWREKRPENKDSFLAFVDELLHMMLFTEEDRKLITEAAITVAEYKRRYPLEFYCSVLRIYDEFRFETSCSFEAADFWRHEYDPQFRLLRNTNSEYMYYSLVCDIYEHGFLLDTSERYDDFAPVNDNAISVPYASVMKANKSRESIYDELNRIIEEIEDEDSYFKLIDDKERVQDIRCCLRILQDAGYPVVIEKKPDYSVNIINKLNSI